MNLSNFQEILTPSIMTFKIIIQLIFSLNPTNLKCVICFCNYEEKYQFLPEEITISSSIVFTSLRFITTIQKHLMLLKLLNFVHQKNMRLIPRRRQYQSILLAFLMKFLQNVSNIFQNFGNLNLFRSQKFRKLSKNIC